MIMILTVMGGCTQATQEQTPPDKEQSAVQPGSIASEYLKEIEELGPRIAGTETEAAAGDWIQAELEENGLYRNRGTF